MAHHMLNKSTPLNSNLMEVIHWGFGNGDGLHFGNCETKND